MVLGVTPPHPLNASLKLGCSPLKVLKGPSLKASLKAPVNMGSHPVNTSRKYFCLVFLYNNLRDVFKGALRDVGGAV